MKNNHHILSYYKNLPLSRIIKSKLGYLFKILSNLKTGKVVGVIYDNKDLLFVFTFTFLIFLPQTNNICNDIKEFGYDTQNLLVWSYLKDLNSFPVRDTFYPHGFLFYFVNNNAFILLIYLLLTPLYYSVYYLTLKTLYVKDKLLVIIFIVLFTISMFSVIDTRNFIRYSMLPVAIFGITTIYLSKFKNIYKNLMTGAIASLTMFANEGIGFLVFIYSLMFLFFDCYYMNILDTSKGDIKFTKRVITFILAIILGLIPFGIFLIRNNLFYEYTLFFTDIRNTTIYAKNPVTVDGRFTIIIFLLMLVLVLSVRRALLKIKVMYKSYLYFLMSSFSVILLVLPKYVLRQMNSIMIMYFEFIILIILFPLIDYYRNSKIKHRLVIFGVIAFVLSFNIVIISPLGYTRMYQNVGLSFRELANSHMFDDKLCKLDKANFTKSGLDPSYYAVVNHIKNLKNEAVIYSYPYDPVFYLLFKQTPPPYLNVYEGSPDYAQIRNVNYIKKMNIDYVIYNVSPSYDGNVPEYVRAKQLSKYLTTNFTPIDIIDTFVILAPMRNNDTDFFKQISEDNKYRLLSNKLLNPRFGYVFKSDAIYKRNILEKEGKLIFSANNFNQLNSYLTESEFSSGNTFILFEFDNNSRVSGGLTLKTKEGLKTTLDYYSCINTKCLVELDWVPLFYNNRIIKSITSDTDIKYLNLYKMR